MRKFSLSSVATPFTLATWAFQYAHQGDFATERGNIFVLDEFDKRMNKTVIEFPHLAPPDYYWATEFELEGAELHHDNVLALAIRAGVFDYVLRKLEADPDLIHKKCGRPLLHYAVQETTNLVTPFCPSSAMVDLLFRYGAEPYCRYEGRTGWYFVLDKLWAIMQDTENCEGRLEWLRIMTLFLQNVAQPNDTVHHVIGEILNDQIVEELDELRTMLEALGVLKEEEQYPLKEASSMLPRVTNVADRTSEMTYENLLRLDDVNSGRNIDLPRTTDKKLVQLADSLQTFNIKWHEKTFAEKLGCLPTSTRSDMRPGLRTLSSTF